MKNQKLLSAVALLLGSPVIEILHDVVDRDPARTYQLFTCDPALRLEHEEVVRIDYEKFLERRGCVRDIGEIPDQRRLRHHAFRLDRDERDWPLIANERVFINVPVELVHAPLMIETLIDGARFHCEMFMLERYLDHFSRRYRENGVVSIDAGLKLGPYFFEDDPKARCVDHPMAGEHKFAEVTIRTISYNEIGVEEQQKRICDLGTEIDEAAIERFGQYDAVIARKVGY